MVVTDAQTAPSTTVAHVQLGVMSPEDAQMLEEARNMGHDTQLTSARIESMPMWKYKKNWVPDEVFSQQIMLKVQVPLDGEPEDSTFMVYDEQRRFNINISKKNCPEFIVLLNEITSKGSANGYKAYIPAQMPDKADGQMKLDLTGLVAKLPW